MSSHEREVEEFEILKADWVSEKEALEDTLCELRDKLKEKQTALNGMESQKVLKIRWVGILHVETCYM